MEYEINPNLIIQEVVNGKVVVVLETEEGFFFENELYNFFFITAQEKGISFVIQEIKKLYLVDEYENFISELVNRKILLKKEKEVNVNGKESDFEI